ncbi:host attachment protein [Shewanella sp. AS16]|uniref:host attachment protein n=1 Tax=Shewanella sp. AS16 TaxID=2907625 RepID=UPI001F231B5F|nr:host attachment protein [Shewanella sp. AS16]MCE9685890.1 host attachment protein [Shewanella sp. AS16]
MNFNNSVLVLADLGQLKAYRVAHVQGIDRHEGAQVGHTQNRGTEKNTMVLDLITDIDYIDGHKKVSERVSDQAGRFRASNGEAHNLKSEQEKQMLKVISEDIRSIIEAESPSSWYLAFPKQAHKELQEMLNTSITHNLQKVVPSDLTKTAKDKLLAHFQ